jgi:hypothetical protein
MDSLCPTPLGIIGGMNDEKLSEFGTRNAECGVNHGAAGARRNAIEEQCEVRSENIQQPTFNAQRPIDEQRARSARPTCAGLSAKSLISSICKPEVRSQRSEVGFPVQTSGPCHPTTGLRNLLISRICGENRGEPGKPSPACGTALCRLMSPYAAYRGGHGPFPQFRTPHSEFRTCLCKSLISRIYLRRKRYFGLMCSRNASV